MLRTVRQMLCGSHLKKNLANHMKKRKQKTSESTYLVFNNFTNRSSLKLSTFVCHFQDFKFWCVNRKAFYAWFLDWVCFIYLLIFYFTVNKIKPSLTRWWSHDFLWKMVAWPLEIPIGQAADHGKQPRYHAGPQPIYNPITAMRFLTMFTFQLDNNKR